MINGLQMPDAVTVLVSTELLAMLEADWSPPCQIQIVRTPGIGSGYEMTARAHTCPPDYPHPYGDVIVLGPETFKAPDDSVISHKGENYYPTSVVITSSETHTCDTQTEQRMRQALTIISGAVDDLMGGRPLDDVIGEIGKIADTALDGE